MPSKNKKTTVIDNIKGILNRYFENGWNLKTDNNRDFDPNYSAQDALNDIQSELECA